ncbi:MAG: polysaccharide pyruvyl transferase family protein [Erythrobacter sp.]
MKTRLISLPYLGFSEIEADVVIKESLRFSRLAANKLTLRALHKMPPKQGYIDHFGVHRPRNNAGDTVLFDVLQKLLSSHFGPLSFRNSALRAKVTDQDVARINAAAQAVLVGGGGLLIEDSNPNAESGWQWRISEDHLARIDKPLILFAIGYNLFRTDKPPSQRMVDHVEKTMDKSVFFGMRNHGSIERTKAMIAQELHHKIIFQPCMTTFLTEYHPSLKTKSGADGREKRIALNLAFDRAERRFGDQADAVLERIGGAVDHLIQQGWQVDLTLHGWDDEPAIAYFRKRGSAVNPVYLNLCTPDEVVEYYADVPLTFGMRGHAQMIPFGCGNPIFSLISHDKLGFFLDDIGHREWGADIFDADLGDKIVDFARLAHESHADLKTKISKAKAKLWAQTQTNLKTLPLTGT